MPNIGQILRLLHIPWPEADEGKLREAAAAWHNLAETIRDAYGGASRAATSIMSNNAGAAVNAFEDYWQKFGNKGNGALALAATACDATAHACDQYADAAGHIKTKIEEAGLEAGAALTVGTIGAFFTFGATEDAADAIAASIMGRVTALMEDFLGVTAEISQTAEAILGSAIAGMPVGAVAMLDADVASNMVRQGLGEQPLGGDGVRGDLVKGLLAGGAGGFLGKVGQMSAAQLSKLLSEQARTVAASGPQLFVDMMSTSHMLSGMTGKVATGVAADAASQLLVSQQINARDLTGNGLEKVLEEAVTSGG
jgi:hypothetical protein